MSPRPSTSSSQPRFTAWLCLGISKPSTSSCHLILLYSSGRVSWEKHGWGLNLHHLGNTRAYALSGQLQTTGAPPPFSCTADLPLRVEVGGRWSQPILAADRPE